ncbi:hypothetical protein [Streptomyces sp. NPDC096311]|uniref:hypothetical protein n=1 Tax=Streptomyces sp. NPDC096311 TaxID=3366083 RepID=UPI00381F0F86
MSDTLGLYRFVDGELVPPDMDVVRAVLAPYGAVPGKTTADGMDFWIRADDGGEAELSISGNMVGVERPALGKIRGVIAELADRIGAGVLTPPVARSSFARTAEATCPRGWRTIPSSVPRSPAKPLKTSRLGQHN